MLTLSTSGVQGSPLTSCPVCPASGSAGPGLPWLLCPPGETSSETQPMSHAVRWPRWLWGHWMWDPEWGQTSFTSLFPTCGKGVRLPERPPQKGAPSGLSSTYPDTPVFSLLSSFDLCPSDSWALSRPQVPRSPEKGEGRGGERRRGGREGGAHRACSAAPAMRRREAPGNPVRRIRRRRPERGWLLGCAGPGPQEAADTQSVGGRAGSAQTPGACKQSLPHTFRRGCPRY